VAAASAWRSASTSGGARNLGWKSEGAQAEKGGKFTISWVVRFLSLTTGTASIAIRRKHYFAIDFSATGDCSAIKRRRSKGGFCAAFFLNLQ
jgi:hypothetical protein